MSEALYNVGGLRFWNEREILLREQNIVRLSSVVKDNLLSVNPGWKFFRVEGPLLTPKNYVSESYTNYDIFYLQAKLAEEDAVLRPETTASSYLYANTLLHANKLPLCVWQAGKSFRREINDGASAAKLRYNEFYQLEFQCLYSKKTFVDYREKIIANIAKEISIITRKDFKIVNSDRLPKYSDSTKDIEVFYNGKMMEVASVSIRNDFPKDDVLVLEIAIGLDRLVTIQET